MGIKAAYDFHIHTAGSPCGDDDMTPNNIVNMALIKELDIIAVTDHNSAENAAAVIEVGREAGLVVIPGMEAETIEEFHTVCLMPDLARLMDLQDFIYSHLPPIKNRTDIFGTQNILNTSDEIIGENPRLLITAADISINQLLDFVTSRGGVAVPAHVDRQSYSIITSLGFIPEDLGIGYIEISKNSVPEVFCHKNPYLAKYKYIQSSDAHYLTDISERENFLNVEELTIEAVIKKLTTIVDFF